MAVERRKGRARARGGALAKARSAARARSVRAARSKGAGGTRLKPGPARRSRARAAEAAAERSDRSESLATLVTLAGRLFARALHGRLVPHGVAPGQLAVLQRLWQGDGLTQATLARAVRVEQPTMARTLDRMARDGLIERVPSKEDRRAFNVCLTARGRLLRKAVESEAAALDLISVEGLKRADRQGLSKLLRQVVGNLEAITGDGEDA